MAIDNLRSLLCLPRDELYIHTHMYHYFGLLVYALNINVMVVNYIEHEKYPWIVWNEIIDCYVGVINDINVGYEVTKTLAY